MTTATFPGELVGEEIEVIHSRNLSMLGIKGRIVNETKATLVLDCKGVRKTVLKNAVTIRVVRTGRAIPGASLLRRPEERIK